MLVKEISTKLFADYYQFYLQDEFVSGDLSNSWTEEAVERLLAITDGTIGVGTVRNMDVEVVLKIYDFKPDMIVGSNSIQKVNECDLEMKTENLVVAGCTDFFPTAMRIKIGKGLFRVRIYYRDLDKISANELDGEDNYELHVWPSKEKSGVGILKGRDV